MPEIIETAPVKEPIKSFEDAILDFQKQAEANEYSVDDPPGGDKEPAPTKPSAKAEKAEKTDKAEKTEKKSSGKRAPDAAFKSSEAADDKPAIPVEEASEFDAIQAPEFKDPAKKGQWDTLHAKAKEWEKKAKELEKRGANQPDVAKLQADYEKKLAEREAKLAEFSALVERTNVEAHPDFRAKYVDGRAVLIQQAQSLIADNGGDSKAVETALNLKGKARIEALREVADELPGYQQGMLGQLIMSLDTLDNEAAEKRAKSSESWRDIQAEQAKEQQRAQQEFAVTAIKAHESTKHEMMRDLEVLKKVEGLDWWNQQADDILQKADKQFRENDDPRESSKAWMWKEAGPVYRDLYMEERKHTDAIEKELADSKKALSEAYGGGPRASGRTGDNGQKSLAKMTFEERIEHEMIGA